MRGLAPTYAPIPYVAAITSLPYRSTPLLMKKPVRKAQPKKKSSRKKKGYASAMRGSGMSAM